MKKFFQIIDIIVSTINQTMAVLGLSLGVLLAFINVILRYAFDMSLTWAAELTNYLFIWAALFGAAYGFKHFSSSKQPIVTPEDAKGLKFRIQSSKVLEAQFKAVGGNPQVLPFSEVYSALQQGVVDGTENPLSNFYTKKFHEVQSNLTLSNHGYLGYLVVMNSKFWDKLPKDLQANVAQAMKEATELERKESAVEDAKIMEELTKYSKETGKLQIVELTPEQKEQWKKAMSVVYPQFYDVIGEDLIKKAIDTK